MKHKSKEIIKDIVIMAYGFIGSCFFFWLFVLNDLNYLTGDTIKEISNIAYKSFIWFGVIFVGVVGLLLNIRKLIKRYKGR